MHLDLEPHVVLLDINMPEMDGIKCAQNILLQKPNTKLLFLTGDVSEAHLFDACQRVLRLRLSGILTKHDAHCMLRSCIDAAMRGAICFSPAFHNLPIRLLAAGKPTVTATQSLLTSRELEVARLQAKGFSYREIANILGVTYSTVNTHLTRIRDKVGVHSSAEMIHEVFDLEV